MRAPPLWAALAAMAISARQLDTAEIALAAVDEVDKLHYILYIKARADRHSRLCGPVELMHSRIRAGCAFG